MERNDITDRPFRIKLWEHSPSTEVICSFGSYMHNGTLALELMCKPKDPMMREIFGGGHQFFERYGTVTVNLDISHILPLNVQFVDENNMPGIGRWLQENNIAKPTGVGIKSGYVTYQAYAFNVPKQSLAEVESRRRQLNTLPPRADDMRQAARPKIK